MKLSTDLLTKARTNGEVRPGNIYPAMGGRRRPSTEYWLVVATSDTSAHLIGFSAEGHPVSTASYGLHAMRERPIIGRADVAAITLEAV